MNNRYKLTGKLGEGVHGVVLKAIDLTSNREVAIKKVSLKTKHGDISISTMREIKVLQNCDCKYVSICLELLLLMISNPYLCGIFLGQIMTLVDIFPDLTGLSLVLDYMPYTLYSKLRDEANPLSRLTVKSYTTMLLLGIKYMHSFDIMHRVGAIRIFYSHCECS